MSSNTINHVVFAIPKFNIICLPQVSLLLAWSVENYEIWPKLFNYIPSWFIAFAETLLSDMSKREPKMKPAGHSEVGVWFPFWFSFELLANTGTKSNTKIVKKNNVVLPLLLVWISAWVYRRSSWTPKTKPNGHFSMAGWFRFRCSTWLLMSFKKLPS